MSPQNNSNYKESESVILNLETLNTKYNNLLLQYKQAVADYVNFLNNSNNSNKTLTSIQGQAFWGTGQAGDQAAYTDITDVNSCAALCSKTTNCTGATFNPKNSGQPMCWLRTGEGNSVPSKPNDYAIVPQAQQLLLNLQTINKQLTNVNNQILSSINNSNSLYSTQTEERSKQASLLLDDYTKLNKERIKFEKMVNEYQDLDQSQIQGDLMINKNYYSFLLLFLLAIIFIAILYKFSYPSSSSSSSSSSNYFTSQTNNFGININYVMLLIILLVVFIYYYSFVVNYASGIFSVISSSVSTTFRSLDF